MRAWKSCCLLLVVALVAGCAKNKELAHEMAAQNLYQEVAYDNMAQPGPSVVVLPGRITSSSYEFLALVNPDSLREFGELELAKANFTVREKASLADIYQEIALAANLGDGSAARRFARLGITPPQWFVVFDVVDVKTQTTDFSFTDKNAAAVAGALMGGLFLGSAGAQMGAGLVGSVNAAKEQRRWDITLQYRILDGDSGQQIAQGSFTEQAVIKSELNGFLGIDAGQTGGITLSTAARRLIQNAVRDIDASHKLPAVAAAEAAAETAAETAARPKPGKAAKAGRQQETDPLADLPQAGETEPEMVCAEKRLDAFVCQMPVQWSTSSPPSALEVALAKKPQLGKLMEHTQSGKKNDLIDSMIEFDILRTAGPLVTLSEPESPLTELGSVLALTGDGLDGRIFMLSDASGKITPEKLSTAVLEHLRRASVVEPLGIETVEGRDKTTRPIMVYKYIQVEQRREVQERPDYDQDSKPQSKLVSIPHYHTMAMAVLPKGNNLLLLIVIAPEDRFLPHLDGVKKMVGSAV